MAFKFVLIDLSTDVTPAPMRPASCFDGLIQALSEQIVGPFATEWGVPEVTFRVASGPEDRMSDEIAINFRDAIPEAPGALAYHFDNGGIPDVEIGVDLFDSLTDSDGVVMGVSHEILETLLDPGANEWADLQDGSGNTRAKEACDLVQNTGYRATNGAWVSNFVTQAAFIPGSTGPWDYLGVMSGPFDVSNGYNIVASAPTPVQDGTMRRTVLPRGLESMGQRQRRRKRHAYSRAYRRGVRV